MKIRVGYKGDEQFVTVGESPSSVSLPCPKGHDGKPMGAIATLKHWRKGYTEEINRLIGEMRLIVEVLEGPASPALQRHDYATVPAGTYRCRIAEVRPGTTRAGDPRWSLRLVVSEGEHKGKQAAWDSIVFNTHGHDRVKRLFAALGYVPIADQEIRPGDIEGLEAMVTIQQATYPLPSGGEMIRNEVPYDGYRPLA